MADVVCPNLIYITHILWMYFCNSRKQTSFKFWTQSWAL